MDTIGVHQVEQMDAYQLEQMDYESKSCLARNPDTNPAILTQLSKDKREDIRASVAVNPSTPENILYKLLNDKKIFSVVASLACNPCAPAKLLQILSEMPHDCIKNLVASNENISEETALSLTKSSSSVRLSLTFNPGISKNVIALLLEDEDEAVKASAAEWVLRSLLKSKDKVVRACAEFYLNKCHPDG